MSILDVIFPRKCLECGKEGRYTCSACLSKVKLAKPICPRCERPSVDGTTHFKCRRKLGLDGLVSIWAYEGAIRKALLALKYKFAFDIAKELSMIFVDSLHAASYLLPTASILVPIPLHWHRGNWRGFNQSEEIGKLVAQKMGWRFIPDLLIKKKSTTPQTELKGADRTKNVKGVFALNPNCQLQTTSYLLFDDVWTTGSTMKEACKVLKRRGVKSVWGLTIAR